MKQKISRSENTSEKDDRGVRFDSAFYPHTILCIRAGMSLTNPQPCSCGGNELMKEKKELRIQNATT